MAKRQPKGIPVRRPRVRMAGARQQGLRGRGPVQRQRRRRFDLRTHQRGAQARLRRFRQGSALAVAVTAIILVILGGDTAAQETGDTMDSFNGNGAATHVDAAPQAALPAAPDAPSPDPSEALEHATGTMRDLIYSAVGLIPNIIIAVLLVLLAAVLARALHWVFRRTLFGWEKTEAITALAKITLYLLAIAAAISVLAGDARAMLGSAGLIGLALSWALQTPIESFTGWLLNSFRGYYRVGDRIEVGDVFGDVYKIDVLTTTVWEAGGPGKAVTGAQPTGAMITFPNWEVLRSNIVNYSRDFPYVWDEVRIGVANESDLAYTVATFQRVASEVVGERMVEPAQLYRQLLQRARLAFDVAEEPKVFVSLADSWTDLTVRYLVHARERRRWASELVQALTSLPGSPEHSGRIIPAYPRSEVMLRPSWDERRNAPDPPPAPPPEPA